MFSAKVQDAINHQVNNELSAFVHLSGHGGALRT